MKLLQKINYPVEAVACANVLPPLKGTTLELCKIGHRMEHAYGKQLLQINDENGGIRFNNGFFLEFYLCIELDW